MDNVAGNTDRRPTGVPKLVLDEVFIVGVKPIAVDNLAHGFNTCAGPLAPRHHRDVGPRQILLAMSSTRVLEPWCLEANRIL